MKYFSDFLDERKTIIEAKKVEQNDKLFNEKVKSVLYKMGVQSPTQLTESQYQEYLQHLSDIKKGLDPIIKKQEVKKTVETVNKKYVTLSEEQRNQIQKMVNVAPLTEVSERIAKIFKAQCPNDFKSVLIENNGKTLKLNFVNQSYSFIKDFEINEKEIKTDKEFEEYATTVLKQAHGDNYDENIAKKTIDDLLKKYGSEYGAAVGALTSGLGQ